MPKDAIDRIRQKYPEYNDLSDQVLAQKILAKYPVYQDILGDVAAEAPQAPAPTPASTGQRILSGIGQGELDWLRFPIAMAQQAGHELTSIPRYVMHPTQFLQEAGRGAEAIVGATPEIAGGVTGGLVAGPPGVVAGPAAMRGLTSTLEGKPIEQIVRELVANFGLGTLGSALPEVVSAAKGAGGRYLSMPAERMVAGAEIMEAIPGKFGVSDDLVHEAYARAERLSRTPPQAPAAPKPAAAAAVAPAVNAPQIEDAVSRLIGRGIRPDQAAERVFTEALQRGEPAADVLQAVNTAMKSATGGTRGALTPERAAQIAKQIPAPKASAAAPVSAPAGRPAALNAQLTTMSQRVETILQDIRRNPLGSIRDKESLKVLQGLAKDIKQLSTTGASPEQLDGIVKAVNRRIAQAGDSATEGSWRHILGGVHQDLRTAVATTKDPAFAAYADAIAMARLNFLRQDLEKVIKQVGVRPSRTASSVITSPGPVLQWMKTHPEWVEGVEKAQPGLLAAIRGDLQEIIPITNIRAGGIPGQRYGSGRYALGASAAYLIAKLLGVPPESAASMGALLAGGSTGLEAIGGLRMSPEYIRRSFAPRPTAPASPIGALATTALGEMTRGND